MVGSFGQAPIAATTKLISAMNNAHKRRGMESGDQGFFFNQAASGTGTTPLIRTQGFAMLR